MPPKNPTVDLKHKYQRMFEIGIILSIAFVLLAFKMFPEPGPEDLSSNQPDMPTISVYVPPTGKPLPPPPPKPPIPVEAPLDEDLIDVPIDETDLDPSDIIENTKITFEENTDEIAENIIFIAVEDMPSPVGGISELQRKVIYPDIAVRAGIQGNVTVRAIVQKNGILDSVHVVQGIGAGCDQAAIDAVVKSKFKPGTQRGKPVNVWISIPIRFQLN